MNEKLTRREIIAATVASGVAQAIAVDYYEYSKEVAKEAVKIADALLKELEKTQ